MEIKVMITSKWQKRDDEYFDENGLLRCNKCNTLRVWISPDKKHVARCACDCEIRTKKEREREAARQKAYEEFNNRRNLSTIGSRYKNVRFANAIITDNNRSAYQKCQNYVANAKTMLKDNIGLYVYGDNSSGKTHLTACMCNELLSQGYYCVYTNLATILDEIRSSYDKKGMGDSKLITRLQTYDFAFIDDLGKEFIGREHNASSAKWAEEKLYEIINARYNAEKPMIFSSNYEIGELASVLDLDKAIIERIDEMSTRVMKLSGDDFRGQRRNSKSDIAKKYGV